MVRVQMNFHTLVPAEAAAASTDPKEVDPTSNMHMATCLGGPRALTTRGIQGRVRPKQCFLFCKTVNRGLSPLNKWFSGICPRRNFVRRLFFMFSRVCVRLGGPGGGFGAPGYGFSGNKVVASHYCYSDLKTSLRRTKTTTRTTQTNKNKEHCSGRALIQGQWQRRSVSFSATCAVA